MVESRASAGWNPLQICQCSGQDREFERGYQRSLKVQDYMQQESKFVVKSSYQELEKQETSGGSAVCASWLHSNRVVGEEKEENPG